MMDTFPIRFKTLKGFIGILSVSYKMPHSFFAVGPIGNISSTKNLQDARMGVNIIKHLKTELK